MAALDTAGCPEAGGVAPGAVARTNVSDRSRDRRLRAAVVVEQATWRR
ncbi:MAG: hypothetical protein M0Z95_04650 [Actinomycetota bacterium]|nr:hypothetical protein [Actinomycetota bacterium]